MNVSVPFLDSAMNQLCNLAGYMDTVRDYNERVAANMPETILGSLSNMYFSMDSI